MIKIDGFVLLLAFITVGGLCYGAGKIGFKNLWGFDSNDKSNSNVIKFIGGRYVKPDRKAQ
ncbi:hypothetical protein [Latilactobacillus sakei]|uniref:hypothetical protein n=1 Tax=Latilactobacillus sakei TaxID=1599 RepID=UPI003F53DFD6